MEGRGLKSREIRKQEDREPGRVKRNGERGKEKEKAEGKGQGSSRRMGKLQGGAACSPSTYILNEKWASGVKHELVGI